MHAPAMDPGGRPMSHPMHRPGRSRAARALVLCVLLSAQGLWAAPRQVDAYQWDGVDRVVAVGDLHGDYDHYLAALRAAGIVDGRGRWIAGGTHLVQTGDIPDRGPDTRRIIAHLGRLAREARRKGGAVHALMGNHEAMNVTGDLRYVTEGEYRAFADRRSSALRDRYYKASLEALAAADPGRAEALAPDHRQAWDREHPLGWVEHRFAWDPRWNPDGELFQWTMRAPVAIRINDMVFVHGGISAAYCGNSLESLKAMARAALRGDAPGDSGILRDPAGPLWDRGLAGVEPATPAATVDAVLEHHGARRIVIGHTPTGGVIWPRLDGRVVMIDTGLSTAYGGHIGWLEATPDGLFAEYPGGRLPLPPDDAGRLAYLDAVIALDPGNAVLARRRERLREGAPDTEPAVGDEAPAAGADGGGAAGEAGAGADGAAVATCGISR